MSNKKVLYVNADKNEQQKSVVVNTDKNDISVKWLKFQ